MGNLKSMIFGGNISHKSLEIFKPPLHYTKKKHLYNDGMMIEPNEQFTHNNQTNHTLHPMNYTNTQNHPTYNSMNYTDTRTKPTPQPTNFTNTQTNPIIF